MKGGSPSSNHLKAPVAFGYDAVESFNFPCFAVADLANCEPVPRRVAFGPKRVLSQNLNSCQTLSVALNVSVTSSVSMYSCNSVSLPSAKRHTQQYLLSYDLPSRRVFAPRASTTT
jgi:hypothetical protein